MDVEKAVLEEFGRCMTQIINSTQSGIVLNYWLCVVSISEAIFLCLQQMKMELCMSTNWWIKGLVYSCIIIMHSFLYCVKPHNLKPHHSMATPRLVKFGKGRLKGRALHKLNFEDDNEIKRWLLDGNWQ